MTSHPDGLKAMRHAGVYCGTPEERIYALEGQVKDLVEETTALRAQVKGLLEEVLFLREDVGTLSHYSEARGEIDYAQIHRPYKTGAFR